MNRTIYILAFLIVSCGKASESQNINQRVSPPNISVDKGLEIERICEIHQFLKDNNSYTWIAKRTSYYQDDKIAIESFNEFKESSQQGKANSSSFYDYKDGKLVQIRSVNSNNTSKADIEMDSIKKIIEYNELGQISKETSYQYRRRIPRKTIEESQQMMDINVIEFEKDRTWDIIKTKLFKYDSEGRKIETYEPINDINLKSSSQNIYTWLYGDDGKLLEHCSYDQEELIWKEEYSYSDKKYNFKRIWYDHEGKPKHLKINEPDYWPLYSFHYILDEKEREISEITKAETKNFYGRSSTQYYPSGRILKKVKFDANDEIDVTHIYKYKKVKAANNGYNDHISLRTL